ncbi:CD99 antigen-like protein 2 isoform X1 [Misgurnus anguillicaudatus]|uniref:CD99 antigen-like protein 2 isoform X1 n=1 Tax=Misgurnus anguillicaudatus TaxID=75329 RepID=UPI003CCF272D
MAKLSTWTLLAVFSLLVVKGFGQDFNLADAFDDEPSTPPPKVKPAGGDVPAVKPTPKRPVQPMVPGKDPAKPKPKETEETYSDFFDSTIRPGLLPRTTTKPLQTTTSDGFDLADALDPNNDIKGKGKDSGKKDLGGGGRDDGQPNSRGGGDLTDDDLAEVGKDETYNPDKGKGGRVTGGSDSEETESMPETGTIAGIASAIGMALIGAVSGYISYQKKKFCFSIQQSLNTDMVKADAPDAVVAQEPQVQQTLLQPPNAEPPTEENAV